MTSFFIILSIIIFIVVAIILWRWYRHHRHQRQMAARKDKHTKIATPSLEEESSGPLASSDQPDTLFAPPVVNDAVTINLITPIMATELEESISTPSSSRFPKMAHLSTVDSIDLTNTDSKFRPARVTMDEENSKPLTAKLREVSVNLAAGLSSISLKKRRLPSREEDSVNISSKRRGATRLKDISKNLSEDSSQELFADNKRRSEFSEKFSKTTLPEDNPEDNSAVLALQKRGGNPWFSNEPVEEEDFSITLSQRTERMKANEVTTSSSLKRQPLKTEAESEVALKPPELILALYVISQHGGFLGPDLFDVLGELGLNYGEKNIFHHYGVGEIKVKNPIFSIANMLEPGMFDPQRITQFTTPGLALFMRVPGPFGGRVAFELMLKTAQRIAESLEGELRNEKHQPLAPQVIYAIRERIANFERRDSHLALRKRFL